MWCPKCKNEYRPGFTHCPDCDVDLVDSLDQLPVPVIFFFARKVLDWGADKKYTRKFFTFCLEKGHRGGAKLQEKAGKGLYFALFLFVGIPVPGTGTWTGTLACILSRVSQARCSAWRSRLLRPTIRTRCSTLRRTAGSAMW